MLYLGCRCFFILKARPNRYQNPVYKSFTELEIVQGCLRGRPEMQRALYQKFSRTMFGICLRYTRDKMAAEDVLQLGFLKVFDHLETYRGGSLEGWMKRIFIRASIDQYRQSKRALFSYTDEILEDQAVTLDEITDKLAMEELIGLINTLPEGCRMVFNLYAVEGYTHKEIGDMLAISPNTSKAQYARAKELLIEKIYARESR